MLRQKIKQHRVGLRYEQPHFFILCKGRNSGKPKSDCYCNSFVFLADSEEERTHFFFLCDALWQQGFFRPLLVGSVIEFIRIDEFAIALNRANVSISQNKEDFQNMVSYFKQLDLHRENLLSQIKLLHQLKQAMVHKMLKAQGR